MKKMFIVLAVGTLVGCSAWQNILPMRQERTEPSPHPRFVTEPPYALSNLYEETSAPQMYSVVAARVTNKMLEQTTKIYDKPMRPKLYVMQIKKAGVEHIPDGFYHSRRVTKEMIEGAKTFIPVNEREDADYVLDITVSRLNVQSIQGDVLQYKMILSDKSGNEVGSWMENIRQVQNDDRSWW